MHTLNELPQELLAVIQSFLVYVKDFQALSLVSKQFHIVNDYQRQATTSLSFKTCRLSQWTIVSILSQFPYLKHLDLSRTECESEILTIVSDSFQRLKSITVVGCHNMKLIDFDLFPCLEVLSAF